MNKDDQNVFTNLTKQFNIQLYQNKNNYLDIYYTL